MKIDVPQGFQTQRTEPAKFMTELNTKVTEKTVVKGGVRACYEDGRLSQPQRMGWLKPAVRSLLRNAL